MRALVSNFAKSIILLASIFISTCQSGNNLNNTRYTSEMIEQESSKPSSDNFILFQTYPIQRDTSIYHYFGEIKLRKNTLPPISGGLGEYLSQGNTKGYLYVENYPTILNKININTNKLEELIFYDTSGNKVIKKVSLKEENPYNDKHSNLIYAYPSFEYYKGPPDNLIDFYHQAEPEVFLTYYESPGISFNGYSPTRYYLVGISNGYIQSWETTILIHNSGGENIGIIQEPNVVSICAVSDDGSLIAYKYGGSLENPYDDAPDGEIRIRNIKTGDLVFHYVPSNGFQVGMQQFYEIGNFVGIGHDKKFASKQDTIYADFIDLNNKIRYRKDFGWNEYFDARMSFKCTSCLILHFAFNQTEI